MSWVAVAVGAAGALSAGASYAGSKKQGDAAKKASGQQLDMFRLVNQQQQPFIQSGYGAMGKLNTLLGLGSRSQKAPIGGGMPAMPQQPAYRPTPGGGIDRRIPSMPQGPRAMSAPKGNPRLAQLLALRAANGDTEAARIMGQI